MLHAPIACQFEPKRENRRTSSPPDRWTGSLLRTSGIEAKPEDGIAAWLWVKDGQTKPGDEVQPVFFVALHSWMNREVHDSASPEVTPTVSSALGVLGTAEEFLKDSTAMLQTHTHTARDAGFPHGPGSQNREQGSSDGYTWWSLRFQQLMLANIAASACYTLRSMMDGPP